LLQTGLCLLRLDRGSKIRQWRGGEGQEEGRNQALHAFISAFVEGQE
jgi:hypothetical protein